MHAYVSTEGLKMSMVMKLWCACTYIVLWTYIFIYSDITPYEYNTIYIQIHGYLYTVLYTYLYVYSVMFVTLYVTFITLYIRRNVCIGIHTHTHSSIRYIGYLARAFWLPLFYLSSLSPEAGFKLNS